MIRGFVLLISFTYQYGFINTKKRLEYLTGSADNNYIETNKGNEMHNVYKSPSNVYWVVKGDEDELIDGPFYYRAEAQELADELNREAENESNGD